jgi:hypothetical protein
MAYKVSGSWLKLYRKRYAEMPPGTCVRSRFHAPWFGVILARASKDGVWVDRKGVEHDLSGVPYQERGKRHPQGIWHLPAWCALVEVTHDRNGKPMRKPIVKVLNVAWMVAMDPPGERA